MRFAGLVIARRYQYCQDNYWTHYLNKFPSMTEETERVTSRPTTRYREPPDKPRNNSKSQSNQSTERRQNNQKSIDIHVDAPEKQKS